MMINKLFWFDRRIGELAQFGQVLFGLTVNAVEGGEVGRLRSGHVFAAGPAALEQDGLVAILAVPRQLEPEDLFKTLPSLDLITCARGRLVESGERLDRVRRKQGGAGGDLLLLLLIKGEFGRPDPLDQKGGTGLLGAR